MEAMAAPAHRDEPIDDYSDAASLHSEAEAKPRRKHHRGGRKASYHEPSPEDMAGLGLEDNNDDENYEESEDEICQYCSKKSQQQPRQQTKAQTKRATIPEPFETGIHAFNIKKATGGRRPVALRMTSDKRKSRTNNTKPATKRTASPKSDNAGHKTQSRSSSSKSESHKGESEEPEQEEEGKPMSIRLDLDLMIEVFLKAKIKGAVTITFLE
ncbi:hypothetical protein VTL71DRAFT_1259 [Oculimacula yallundae]|uniref:Uncharacterized protein n=1 Tax=Oculimacula yallundae TaxID=86028 RepID=A0ABR4CAM4_9HELO